MNTSGEVFLTFVSIHPDTIIVSMGRVAIDQLVFIAQGSGKFMITDNNSVAILAPCPELRVEGIKETHQLGLEAHGVTGGGVKPGGASSSAPPSLTLESWKGQSQLVRTWPWRSLEQCLQVHQVFQKGLHRF